MKESKKQNKHYKWENILDQQNQQLKNYKNDFDRNVNEYERTTIEIINKNIDVANIDKRLVTQPNQSQRIM